MILVSVMYPNVAGSKFDMAYYTSQHIPLVNRHWGSKGLEGVTLVRGLAGGGPDQPATYQIMALLQFASMDALQACLADGGAEVQGDVANFTDVEPILQISEQFS